MPWGSPGIHRKRTVRVMCTSREDAAGAVSGDAAVPAARLIDAVPCEPPGAVDLVDRRHRHTERWHFSPGEWVEFLAAVKDGKYDGAGT